MAQSFLGKGIAFPVRPGPDGGLAIAEGESKIRQSMWLILATAPGERIMRPEFGCGIHELVFEPNTSTVRSLVQVKVREALIRWEPRIDVLDVTTESPPDQRNHMLITVNYRIRSNNAVHNLVYPFYLHEQAA